MPISSNSLRHLLSRPFTVDLRSLALMRALLGGVLMVDLCSRATDLRVFYSDAGIMPRDWLAGVNGAWRVCLHAANGDTWFAAALFGLEMLAALAFIAGWRTRLATIACFVLHASLLNRNLLILEGGDILLVCLLFWAMWLPMGARWSVDAALSQRPLPAAQHLSWASGGLVLQILSVYFFSAVMKSGQDWWPDGTAVDYALQLDAFTTGAGHWLRNFPDLEQGLSLSIYALELFGPLIALSPILTAPLRAVVVTALIAMHCGFIVFMNLGIFPFVSIASLSALTGSWFWEWQARRTAPSAAAPLRIFYDRDCAFCLKTCRLLRVFLILPQAVIAPAQDTPRTRALLTANNSWVVIDHDDQARLKWAALTILLRRSPLFAWLGALLGGGRPMRAGDAAYDFVGRHRATFAKVSEVLLPWRQPRFKTARIAQWFAGLMLFALLAWNLCTVGALPHRLYAALTPPMRILRVDQYWNMFAPYPSRENGWFIIPATLADGREIDLRHPERGAVSYEKPADGAAEYPNSRWLKYFERLRSAEFSANRPVYSKYLCQRWNTAHSGGDQLREFKLVFMLQLSVPRGQTPAIEQRVLSRYTCQATTP